MKLSTIAPGPAEIAAANADDVGEVVIEVVLATGLRKPSVGPMIGPAQCAPPSPFVKLAVRGSEQRSRKEELTNFPMWNERLIWHGKRGALCTPKMHVEVLAWDPLTPTSMGRAEVDLALTAPKKPEPNPNPNPHPHLRPRPHPHPHPHPNPNLKNSFN